MTLKHTKVSGKTDGGDATLVQPTDWNADHTIAGGVDFPDEEPAAPAAGKGRLFNRIIANRRFAVMKSPSSYDITFQPHVGRNQVVSWKAHGNTTTISLDGATAFTIAGTATSYNTATTNRFSRIRKVQSLVTVAATTAVAGWYHTGSRHWPIGNGAADGGFFFIIRGGPATGVTNASHRFAMGLTTQTTAPTDVNPSTLASSIFLGYDAADTQWQIISHNGTTATKVALGASFPKPSTDNSVLLELTLYDEPGGASVDYEVYNMLTGALATGNIVAANLPANTTLMAPRIYASVGGVSSVVGVNLVICYIETEY